MSKYPSKWISHFENYAEIVFVHYEIDEDLSSALNQINKRKMQSGVVLTMATDPSEVKDDITDCSNIMILSIPKPGKSGQSFDMNAISRINKMVLINGMKEDIFICMLMVVLVKRIFNCSMLKGCIRIISPLS